MMPLSEIFFFGIVFYLVYKFLFNFLLPVFKTTKAFKEQFKHMRDNMQDQGGSFQHSRAQQNSTENVPFGAPPKKPEPARPAGKAGEYIDFEEIK